jgi:hypothetical protein
MLWQFLPITLAVVPGLLWEIPYISMCQMQPYQDLASPQGSTLKDSLSQSYVTSFSWFVPYQAMRHPKRHTALAMMSITYLLTYGVLPTATTAMLKIHWDDDNSPTKGTAQPLVYFIILALVVSVSASAFAAAAFIILHRRKSGVYGDPVSIAGLAALVAESNLLDKFRLLWSMQKQAEIDKALGDYQLCLEHTSGRHGAYQISLFDPAQIVPKPPRMSIVRDLSEVRNVSEARKVNEAHPWWLRGRTYLGLSALMIVPSLVIMFTIDHNITSNAFYIKICYAIIAIIGSALAANWHIHVAILQPFHDLADQGSVNALKLDYISSAICNSIPKHSFSVWWMAMCALMMQLSVIILPAVNQNRAFMVAGILSEIDRGFPDMVVPDVVVPDGVRLMTNIYYGFYGTYAFFSLIGLLIIMSTKRKPFMPRKPHTLSSVILYLCHSNELLEDLKGMSMLSKKARDHRLTRNNHKYRFGWILDEAKEYSYVGIDRFEKIDAVFKYPKLKQQYEDGSDKMMAREVDGFLMNPDCWPKKVR